MHQNTKLNTKILARIRYLAYSIPLCCIIALLVGLIYGTCFILPEFNEVYAAEVASSTASMSIANPTLSSTITPNNTTYVSTNVTIDAKYIQSYTLKISGNTNLSGPSTITGAGGKTPANMTNNTWGYNWGNTGTTDSSLTYNSLTTSGTNLTLNSLSNGVANFTKKLTFAVKFGEADTGHYTSTVNLAFTATPKTLTTYSVTYDANGGTGGPSNWSEQSYDNSKTYTIPATQPTRTNYIFLGWADSSSATAAQYSPGGAMSLNSVSPSKTIYAVWGVQYRVSYADNNQFPTSVKNMPDDFEITSVNTSYVYTVPNDIPKAEQRMFDGSTQVTCYAGFLGWSQQRVNADDMAYHYVDFRAGNTITLTPDRSKITLFAVWSAWNCPI